MPHLKLSSSTAHLLRMTTAGARRLVSGCGDCSTATDADCSATTYVIDLAGFSTAGCGAPADPFDPAWAGDVSSGTGGGCGANTCCWWGPASAAAYPDGTGVPGGMAFVTNVACLYESAIGGSPCGGTMHASSTCWYLVLPAAVGPLAPVVAWAGTKTTGNTPAGVYTQTGGCAGGPATISVS